MKKILLASHGTFARGLKDSLTIFLGNCDNITTICAYTEPGSDFVNEIREFIIKNENDGDTIIFTDLYGGSVNTKVVECMLELKKNIPIVAGMNMPLVLDAALTEKKFTDGSIMNSLEECRYVFVNPSSDVEYSKKKDVIDDDFFQ